MRAGTSPAVIPGRAPQSGARGRGPRWQQHIGAANCAQLFKTLFGRAKRTTWVVPTLPLELPRIARKRAILAGDDKRGCGEQGSVLVEAMVGSAIIAITLLGMYEAIVTSASHNRMAEDRRNAIMIAQSELAAVGTIIPSLPGTTEGTQGDFYWRVDIAPYGQDESTPQLGRVANQTGTLCLVTVTVADRKRRPLSVLHTLTLTRGA
jgi:hypothetical protein